MGFKKWQQLSNTKKMSGLINKYFNEFLPSVLILLISTNFFEKETIYNTFMFNLLFE